jgi:hypothetical protein
MVASLVHHATHALNAGLNMFLMYQVRFVLKFAEMERDFHSNVMTVTITITMDVPLIVN